MEGGEAMRIEAAFIQYLLTCQGVTTLVGTRIRPLRTRQAPIKGKTAAMAPDGDTLPRITIDKISNPREACLTGATTLSSPRLQVDVIAASFASANAVAEALRNCLHGFKGWMSEVFVDSCILEDERDFEDASDGLDSAATCGVSMDFILQHQEARPNAVPVLE